MTHHPDRPCSKLACTGTMVYAAEDCDDHRTFPACWACDTCGTVEYPEPPDQPDTIEDLAREYPVALGPGAPYLTDHLGRAIPGADL